MIGVLWDLKGLFYIKDYRHSLAPFAGISNEAKPIVSNNELGDEHRFVMMLPFLKLKRR